MNEALQSWREDFAREPDTAFDRLVRGVVPLGGASQLSFGEILDALFDPGDTALDTAAAGWLEKRILGPVPENTSLHRWVSVLEEYFRGIAAMELRQTSGILRRQHKRLRLWLHGFYEGPDRDPEGAYLIALARAQDDQRFSPLWRRLILGEELAGRPYLGIGILGFRKMPEQANRESSGVPEGLLQVLVELADKPGTGQAKWKQTMRSLFATYRRSESYWVKRFAEVAVSSRNQSENLHSWLSQILPHWPKRVDEVTAIGNSSNLGALPTYAEMIDWQQRVEDDPELSQTVEFGRYLDRYRSHAKATGQTHYLVRTFNSIAVTIVRKLPQLSSWALDLMEEAMESEPLNPRNWTSYAKVLHRNGRTEEALRVLWQARHRFPWHAFAHTDLGRLLFRVGDRVTSVAVLREAETLFPTETVCQTTLAEFFPMTNHTEHKAAGAHRRVGDMSLAERLGRAMIALWQAERAEDATLRSSLCAHATALLEVPEDKIDDDLLAAFVETRGLVLLASGDAQRALSYFEEQIRHYGRGGWIGIQLGDQRARIALGVPKDADDTVEAPSSQSARFALYVARVIQTLAASPQESEVRDLLKTLYPRAAGFAARAQPDAEGGLSIESGAEMLGAFLQTRWFRPAGIQSAEDFDRPDALRAVIERINNTRTDTFDVISNSALALAA